MISSVDFKEIVRVGGTPSAEVVGECVLELLEMHGPMKRPDIIMSLQRRWADSGGDFLTEESWISRFKHCTATLRELDLIRSAQHGIWELTSHPVGWKPSPLPVAEKLPVKYTAERELGVGAGSVYTFFMPTARRLADLEDSDTYPVKIGKTDQAVHTRLTALSTSMYEAPVVPVIFFTDDAKGLESALHGVLRFRQRKITTQGAGNEWYMTNPEELINIYNVLMGI